jgi:hypothetical protein
MLLSRWGAALLVSAAVLVPSTGFADNVEAVEPGGPGVLTKCRSWLVASSCRTYRHISLPDRIAIGDTVTLTFGSHPKEYGFHVARIELMHDRCSIYSEVEGDSDTMDKIEVAPCRRAAGTP